MAEKLTQRDALTTLADGDLFHAVDVSDTADDAAGSSKKIAASDIKTYMTNGYITGVDWDEIGGTQTDISLSGFTDDLVYIAEVSEDTTPVLGGNLDANDLDISNVGDFTFSGDPSNFQTHAGFGGVNFNVYNNDTSAYVKYMRMEAGFTPSFSIYTNVNFVDTDDESKIAKFSAAGITGGNTRTFSFPNKSGTLALANDLSFSGGDGISVTSDDDEYTISLGNVATSTIKGRVAAGTGAPTDLTTAQATTLIDTFTDTLKGSAPASGGGTSNYLRADGTWATPPAGVSTFLALSDTPSAYSGQAGKLLSVNPGESAVEFYSTATASIPGVKQLIYYDETDSAEHNTSTAESSALKTWSLPANSYNQVLIELVVQNRVEYDVTSRCDFTWRIKYSASTIRTFIERVIASNVSGTDSGGRYTTTLSHVMVGGQASAADITVTVQNSLNNANAGALVKSIRVYGFKDYSLTTITSTPSDGNKGDITVSGSGTGYTINANVVDGVKFRQSAGLSLVGRSANTTGDVADITAASDHQVLRRSGTAIAFGAVNLAQANAVTGTLVVANGGTGRNSNTAYALIAGGATTTAAHVSISNGTTGHFLKSGGASANPAFAAIVIADVASLQTSLDAKLNKNATIQLKSGNYTLQASDNNSIIEFDETATLTLPNGLDTGFQVVVVNIGATKTITLSATTTLTSKDSKVTVTSRYGAVTIYHAGSNVWRAVGDLA